MVKYNEREYIVQEDGTIIRPSFTDSAGVTYRQKEAGQGNGIYKRVGGWKNGKPVPVLAHRLVAKAFLDDYSDDLTVDHINGDKRDNRVSNLRMCTMAQNIQYYHDEQGGKGRIYPKMGKTSKFKGVFFDKTKQRWCSKFRCNGEMIYAGTHKTELEAAIAYNLKAKEMLGERFRPNIFEQFPIEHNQW